MDGGKGGIVSGRGHRVRSCTHQTWSISVVMGLDLK